LTLAVTAAAGLSSAAGSRTAAVAAMPGIWKGSSGQTSPYWPGGVGVISFDVASGGKQIHAVTIPHTYLTCAPAGNGYNHHFELLTARVKADGTFSATASAQGVLDGKSTKFSFDFAGRFTPASSGHAKAASGTWDEKIVETGGASCATRSQSWRAHFAVGLGQPLYAAGNYRGSSGQTSANWPGGAGVISFAVTGNKLSGISIPRTSVFCSPSGSTLTDKLTLPASFVISSNGSFVAKGSEDAPFQGVPTTFAYVVSGWFDGRTQSGAYKAAGTWQESIVQHPGATCNSDQQFWSATK
jgi:hypothetical protein